jgi:hypothetical protein
LRNEIPEVEVSDINEIAEAPAEPAEDPRWEAKRNVRVLLRALERAYEGAMRDGKFETAARIVAHAASLQQELPEFERPEDDPWYQFRDDD